MVKHNDEELKLSNFVDDTTIHNDNGSKLFWSSNLYRKVQSANVPLHCRGRLQLGRSCETKSLKSCWTTVGVVISSVKEVGSPIMHTKLGSDEPSWGAFSWDGSCWDESMASCNVKT